MSSILTNLPQLTAATNSDWLYIVDVSDTTDNPAGSSKKILRGDLYAQITGFTYLNNTITLSLSDNSTYDVVIDTMTGLTINGVLSATTYENLPLDVFTTGGTYSDGTLTFTNNSGGTFNVSGLITGDTYWTSGSTGNYSIRVRNNTTVDATGDYGLAEGRDTLASGYASHAEGEGSIASGDFSHAEGASSVASANSTHAEGEQTTASNFAAHSEGYDTIASGYISHSEGSATIASGDVSHSQNESTIAFGDFSHAGGYYSTASGNTSFIHSYESVVLGDRSVVLGGQGITGTTDDTVYVPYFNIQSAITDNLLTDILVLDVNGDVKTRDINTIGFTGGTVSGATIFTGGLSANTFSATTYYNLPLDIFTTGGTFNNSTGIATFTNNSGGTFDVSGFFKTSDDTFTTGFTFNVSNYDLTIKQNNGQTDLTVNLGILASDITITGGTYNPTTGIATFTNNTGGTFSVSGFITGMTDTYVSGFTYSNNNLTIKQTAGQPDLTVNISTMTGLTINGNLVVTGQTTTNSLSASTITATTITADNYENLPFTDNQTVEIFISGGTEYLRVKDIVSTPSGGTRTFQGNVVISSGFTANTISAATYYNLPLDVFTTGGTYNNTTGIATFTNNSGGTFNVSGFFTGSTDNFTTGYTYNNNTFTIRRNNGLSDLTATINTMTGLTINGNLTVTGQTTTNSLSASTLTATTITATDYQNLPFTDNQTIEGFVSGSSTYVRIKEVVAAPSGGTRTFQGNVVISSGFTANTISATTYYNLPLDVFTTGGTYSNGTLTFTNNSGGTFNVSGLITGDTYWTSGSTGSYSIKANNDSILDSTNDYAVAEGRDTLASGIASHAEGFVTTASGNYGSHSEGDNTLASGEASHAEGVNTIASGDFGSHAEGDNTTASGERSHAEGGYTTASGQASHSEGSLTTASGFASHAEGDTTIASGNRSHAGGNNSAASGDTSFIHSTNSKVLGDRSVVLGGQNITGSTNDTVYVPYFNIQSATTNNSLTDILVKDTNGDVKTRDINTIIFTGGTISGPTNFTGGLSANTFTATTYYNLPLDIYTTGGTFNSITGVLTLTNNSGGTFNVSGFTTTTPTLSQVLSSGNTTSGYDIIISSGDTISNTGGTSSIYFGYGIEPNGVNLQSGISTYKSIITAQELNGVSFYHVHTGTTSVSSVTVHETNGISLQAYDNTFTDQYTTIYQTGDAIIVEGDSTIGSGSTFSGIEYFVDYSNNYTNRSLVDKEYVDNLISVSGTYLPLSGGTVSGATNFTAGLTANTLNVTGLTQTSGITSTGGITFKQITINSSYTATTSDYMIDVSGGTFTVSLPSAIGIQGRLLVIKNNGGGAVTVDPYGSETIDDKPFVILGETNSIQLTSNGVNWVAMGYNISTVNSSTGVFEFTGLTKLTDTTFNVGEVKGWIVDDTTNPLSPQLYYVYYSGGSHTALYVNTASETWVYLTSGGTVAQQSTPLTTTQRRVNIFLGKLGHANLTSIINAFSQPDYVLSPLAQLRDMFLPINIINGGVYPSPNGVNLKFNTSAGYIYGLGINFASDTLNPNSLYVSGNTPTTFQYRTQTGGTATNITDIDPTNYDVGGVVTPITGTKATNQRIYLVQNGGIRVMYGQTTYNNFSDAVQGLQTETFTPFSNFVNNGVLIGILTVLSTATDLTDTSKAKFFFASKFGETVGAAGGISTTTLQQAYNNSTNPEITTNSTLNAVQFRGGTGNDADANIVMENNAGVQTGKWLANGGLSATTISATTISATTYQNLPLDVFTTGGTYNSGTGVATFTNNSGGTFSVSGFSSSSSSFTGGTVSGATNFTGGLTANTISATTYNNLPKVGFSPINVGVCDTAPTAASTQYYYQTIGEVTTTLSKVKLWGFSGSDLVIFGIYRGSLGGSMTLIGQARGTCGIGPNELTLSAETGQNLTITAGEDLVVGYYPDGTSWRTVYDVGISDILFGILNTGNITTMPATPTGTATGIRFACTLY